MHSCLPQTFRFQDVDRSFDVGSEIRLREVKTEPSSMFFGSSFGSMQNGSNTGLVSIAITLKPAAAEVNSYYNRNLNHFICHCRDTERECIWFSCVIFILLVQNITDVVAAIADLIRVKIPSSYEVSSGPGNMGAIKTSVEPKSPASALQQPNGPGLTRLGPKQLQLQQNYNKSEQTLLVNVLPRCHKYSNCHSGVEPKLVLKSRENVWIECTRETS